MSSPSSSPDCKRQKLEDDVSSVAEMSNVSPKENRESPTDDVTITSSPSKKVSIVNQSAQTFEDVARLDGFVDRTMLVKELLDEEATNFMIFAPSKFGKSINLNMVRFFFDIEDKHTKTKEDVARNPTMQELRSNPSKKMKVLLRQFEGSQYEECFILREEEFVTQHVGRHPVILFNFKNIAVRNESDAVFECAVQMRESYREHKYLRNSKEFKPDKREHVLLKQACADWCSYNNNALKKLSERDVTLALMDLIKSLRIHWERDPVFLVDEVDKPCIEAMIQKCTEDEMRKVGTVISKVVCSVVKQDKEEVLATLITGISKFEASGRSDIENTVEVYFLGDPRFSKYYGLTANEVDSLVRKLFASEKNEITSIIKVINDNYNGYCQRSSCGITEKEKQIEYARYCLFSVLRYLNQRNVDKESNKVRFWKEGGLILYLVPILKESDVIMNAIQTMMYDASGTIEITYQEEVNASEILRYFCGEVNLLDVDTVFNFFLQRGFLAHNQEKPEEKVGADLKIYVKIPNLEIRAIYENMFKGYCASLPKTVKSAFTSCGNFFKSLRTELESSMQNSAKFRKDLDTLCENLKHIFNHIKCESEASVCFYMCIILKFYAGYEKCEMNYTARFVDNDKSKYVYVDVYGKHGNFVFILEVKHNVNAKGESGKMGSKKKSSLAAAEDIVELLPGKKCAEVTTKRTKAGSGKNLKVLDSHEIKNYILLGMAVDGDGTTHMLVFPKSTKWEDVIAVNPENHVAELISTHLKSKQLISDT